MPVLDDNMCGMRTREIKMRFITEIYRLYIMYPLHCWTMQLKEWPIRWRFNAYVHPGGQSGQI